MARSNHVKVVAFLSGGLDSTGMIYKMIQDGYTVHIHHLIMDRWGSHKHSSEFQAAQNVVNWLRDPANTGDGPKWIERFTWSRFSFNGTGAPPDHLLYAMLGACMVLPDHIPIEWENHTRAIATGRIATDETTTGSALFNKALKIFKAATDNNVQWLRPVNHMCKRDIIQMLPPELVQLTTSCHYPIKTDDGLKDCRNCVGCARKVEGMYQSGKYEPLPEDITNKLNEDEQHEFAMYKTYKYLPPWHKWIDKRTTNQILGIE
tara:strand:- start:1098 stop:1883 length:786 start_codon:yes stop_codon:yes gene_type:complete